MPELPEVETVRLALAPIGGLRVETAHLSSKKLRWTLTPGQLDSLTGRVIQSVERRGRHLLLKLSDNGCLLIHLGMSGWLRLEIAPFSNQAHDHLTIYFSDGSRLTLNDARRFGGVMLSASENGEDLPIIAALGFEPFDDRLDARSLKKLYNGSTKAIKELLMDNALVTGIGNIYASEILFKSRIHPDKPGSKITLPNAETLLRITRDTLMQAIQSGGSTLRDFKHINGESGKAQNLHLVYAKPQAPCPVCQRPIQKSAHGGRSTFFCKACQKKR